MKAVYSFFLLLIYYLILTLLFLTINVYQTFYSIEGTPGIITDVLLGTLFLSAIISYFTIKMVSRQIFIISSLIYIICISIYVLTYTYIPMVKGTGNSKLVYIQREDGTQLFQEDFDSMNVQQIKSEMNSITSFEEKNTYIKNKLYFLSQNLYEQSIYYSINNAPNEGLFYSEKQFLEYKKNEIDKIQNNLNYENIEEKNNGGFMSFIYPFVKRENNYKETGGSLSYLKISKNLLLDIRDGKEAN